MSRRWTNWAGNQAALPRHYVVARSEADVVAAVSRGVAERERVRPVGSGHSFTDIAVTDGIIVDVAALAGVRSIDHATRLVTVGAGTRLADLNAALHDNGLALPNLGDVDRQTIAGAIGTATHGTGTRFNCISAAVAGVRVVTGDGGVLTVDGRSRPELLGPLRANLGALGILTEVTLQCVDAFNLQAVEETLDIDELLASFDEVAAGNEHVEFYWFPGTRTGLRKVNNRTTDPLRYNRRKAFVADEIMGNAVFGALVRLGRRRPQLVAPALKAAVPIGQRKRIVAPSHTVFCSPRRVKFVEMEYAVPREALRDAFAEVRRIADSAAAPITFPIEVRVLDADDIPLSMASGRPSGFIAVHVDAGSSHEAYFAAVEAAMARYDGRPHWGKLHRLGHEQLARLYPRWHEFMAARDELDPDRHFANPYLDRVLGE
jgi:L-gulonolactone oxidase